LLDEDLLDEELLDEELLDEDWLRCGDDDFDGEADRLGCD